MTCKALGESGDVMHQLLANILELKLLVCINVSKILFLKTGKLTKFDGN